MSKIKTRSGKRNIESKLPLNLLKGSLTGIVTFVVLLLLFSLITLKTDIDSKFFFLFMIASSAISALTGAVSTCRGTSSKKLIAGMITTMALLIVEFILFLCFNSVSLSNTIYFIIPIDIVFGFFGCIVGSNIRK